MAENEPVRTPVPQQTADDVPPEALATPPTFIPEREVPEAAEEREARGEPPLPPLKYNHPVAKEAAERQHAEADKQRRSGEHHRADQERQHAEAERHRAEQAKAARK